MVDSPHHAKQTITFKLGKKGVEDHEEGLKEYKKALAKIEEEEKPPEPPKGEDIVENTQGLIEKDLLLE
jgi:hypothetical protein